MPSLDLSTDVVAKALGIFENVVTKFVKVGQLPIFEDRIAGICQGLVDATTELKKVTLEPAELHGDLESLRGQKSTLEDEKVELIERIKALKAEAELTEAESHSWKSRDEDEMGKMNNERLAMENERNTLSTEREEVETLRKLRDQEQEKFGLEKEELQKSKDEFAAEQAGFNVPLATLQHGEQKMDQKKKAMDRGFQALRNAEHALRHLSTELRTPPPPNDLKAIASRIDYACKEISQRVEHLTVSLTEATQQLVSTRAELKKQRVQSLQDQNACNMKVDGAETAREKAEEEIGELRATMQATIDTERRESVKLRVICSAHCQQLETQTTMTSTRRVSLASKDETIKDVQERLLRSTHQHSILSNTLNETLKSVDVHTAELSELREDC